MCDPSFCVDMKTLEAAATDAAAGLRRCLARAGDSLALMCACTAEVRQCLQDPEGGRCHDGTKEHPVDEAQAWCRRFVALQGLGCSESLCTVRAEGRRSPLHLDMGAVVGIAILALLSLLHLAYTFHTNAPAGRQAFGLDPVPRRLKKRRKARAEVWGCSLRRMSFALICMTVLCVLSLAAARASTASGPQAVVVRGCVDPLQVEIRGLGLSATDSYSFLHHVPSDPATAIRACNKSPLQVYLRAAAPEFALGRVNATGAPSLAAMHLCYKPQGSAWRLLRPPISRRRAAVVEGANSGHHTKELSLAPTPDANCFILSAVRYSSVVVHRGAAILVGSEGYGVPSIASLVMHGGSSVAPTRESAFSFLQVDTLATVSPTQSDSGRRRRPVKVLCCIHANSVDITPDTSVLLNGLSQIRLRGKPQMEEGPADLLPLFSVAPGAEVRRANRWNPLPVVEWAGGEVVITSAGGTAHPSLTRHPAEALSGCEEIRSPSDARLGVVRCARLTAQSGASAQIDAASLADSPPAGTNELHRGLDLHPHSSVSVGVLSACRGRCLFRIAPDATLRVGVGMGHSHARPGDPTFLQSAASQIAGVRLAASGGGGGDGVLVFCGHVMHSLGVPPAGVAILPHGPGVQLLPPESSVFGVSFEGFDAALSDPAESHAVAGHPHALSWHASDREDASATRKRSPKKQGASETSTWDQWLGSVFSGVSARRRPPPPSGTSRSSVVRHEEPVVAPPRPVPQTPVPTVSVPPAAAPATPAPVIDITEYRVVRPHPHREGSSQPPKATPPPEAGLQGGKPLQVWEAVEWSVAGLAALEHGAVFHAPVTVSGGEEEGGVTQARGGLLVFRSDVTFRSAHASCAGGSMHIINNITFSDFTRKSALNVEIEGCVRWSGTVKWQTRKIGTLKGTTPSSGLILGGTFYTSDSNPKVALHSLTVQEKALLRFPSLPDRDSLVTLSVSHFTVEGRMIANSSIDMKGIEAKPGSSVIFGSTPASSLYIAGSISGDARFHKGSLLFVEYPPLLPRRLHVVGDLVAEGKVVFHEREGDFGSHIAVGGAMTVGHTAMFKCMGEFLKPPENVKNACLHPFMQWGSLEGAFDNDNIDCTHDGEPLTWHIDQNSLFLLPVKQVPPGNLPTALCLTVLMAAAVTLPLRRRKGDTWGSIASAAITKPPFVFAMPIYDSGKASLISLNSLMLLGITVECLWLGSSTIHPYIRLCLLNALPEGLQTFLFVALCLGTFAYVPLWWKFRAFAEGARESALRELGVTDFDSRTWHPGVLQRVCYRIPQRLRVAHSAASAVMSAALVPFLLALLRPLQCAMSRPDSLVDALQTFPETCPDTYPLAAAHPIGVVFALALGYLVVDTGSHFAVPLRHPPFVPELGVRTKRTFDAGRVLFLMMHICVQLLVEADSALLLTCSIAVQAMYLGWTIATTPCVFDNVNRLRASAQVMALWTVVLAWLHASTGDNIQLCLPGGGIRIPHVLWWLGGCGAGVMALHLVWGKFLNPAQEEEQGSPLSVTDIDGRIEYKKASKRLLTSTTERQITESFAMPYYLGMRSLPDGSFSSLSDSCSDSDISMDLYKNWMKGPVIGRGSFGTVRIGILPPPGGIVAVKIVDFRNDGPQLEPELKRVQKEVDFIKNLRHPNVIEYKACILDERKRRMTIFMEHAANGSLTSLLKKLPNPPRETVAAHFIRQVLQGLSFLHDNGVIHRDIKGENVLLDAHGCVKLADFGCARELSTASFSDTFAGSPYWMAPEVIRNNTGYDAKADIWSVACTAIEVLTCGALPWKPFSNVYATMHHIARSTGHPTNKPTCVSADCAVFFDVCFQRDPAKRPSANDLMQHQWLLLAASPRDEDRDELGDDTSDNEEKEEYPESMELQTMNTTCPSWDQSTLMSAPRSEQTTRSHPGLSTPPPPIAVTGEP